VRCGAGTGAEAARRGAARCGAQAACVAVHPAQRQAAVGTRAGLLLVFKLPEARAPLVIDAGRDGVLGLAFAPCGRWLAARSARGALALHDARARFAKILTVHRPEAGCSEPSYWPPGAHALFAVGASLKAGSDGQHTAGTTTHLITLTSLLTVSVRLATHARCDSAAVCARGAAARRGRGGKTHRAQTPDAGVPRGRRASHGRART
jgi:hypothetical protein